MTDKLEHSYTPEPTARQTARAPMEAQQGGGGWIFNHFQRKTLEAQARTVEAAREVIEARIELAKAMAVYNRPTLDMIEQTERDRVQAIRDEQSLRLAEAKLKKELFAFEARSRKAEAEIAAITTERRLAELKGLQDSKPSEREEAKNKNAELNEAEDRLRKAGDELDELFNEANGLATKEDVSEPEWRAINSKLNRAQETYAAAEEEVERLRNTD